MREIDGSSLSVELTALDSSRGRRWPAVTGFPACGVAREPSEPRMRPGCADASTGEISPVDSPLVRPHSAPPVPAPLFPSAFWSGAESKPYKVHREPRASQQRDGSSPIADGSSVCTHEEPRTSPQLRGVSQRHSSARCSSTTLTGCIRNAADTRTGVGDGSRQLGCHLGDGRPSADPVAARRQVANKPTTTARTGVSTGSRSTLRTSWRRQDLDG